MIVRQWADLRRLNSFGVAAKARYLVRLEAPDDVQRLLSEGRFQNLPRLFLGGGSNVLFVGDFDGVVALVRLHGVECIAETREHVYLRAAAGENWHQFVTRTVELGYGGLENLSLIPGTVGAAPMQNIGAYGVELSQCFSSLEAIRMNDGASVSFDHTACRFGYRRSTFKIEPPGTHLITSMTVRLARRPTLNLSYAGVQHELQRMACRHPTPKTVSEVVCRIRQQKLPDPQRIGNAGSFFKNPAISQQQLQELRTSAPELPAYPQLDGTYKLPAAWLIERCGWRGYRMGDAGVYERHALVLVNHGHASGADIWELATRIRESVVRRFGVLLEPEPLVL